MITRRRKSKLPIFILSACGVGAVISLTAISTGDKDANAVFTTPVLLEEIPTAEPAAEPSPTGIYSEDGTYRVGVDIAPGEYKVTGLKNPSGFGYYEVCLTVECDIMAGDMPDNEMINVGSSSYVVIPEDAATFKITGIVAELVG